MAAEDTLRPSEGTGWLRAAMLFGVTLATSVVQPGVLVAVPFVVLSGVRGMRGRWMFAATALAVAYVTLGPRDGLWYAGRAWAVLLGGCFAGLTLLRPRSGVTGRALGAVVGATGAAAALLAVRPDGWATVDFAVSDAVRGGVARTVEALVLLRGGDALSPALLSAVYGMAEAQVRVFPAMIGIASVAGLAVAWWLHERLAGAGAQALGPVRDFRFNDHLVWVMILGLVMVLARWDGSVARVGSNAVVFMGALYALRGAAVVVFVSGGVSLLGYVALALGLLAAAPIVVGMAMMVGIGDTWLDARARLKRPTP